MNAEVLLGRVHSNSFSNFSPLLRLLLKLTQKLRLSHIRRGIQESSEIFNFSRQLVQFLVYAVMDGVQTVRTRMGYARDCVTLMTGACSWHLLSCLRQTLAATIQTFLRCKMAQAYLVEVCTETDFTCSAWILKEFFT